MDIALVLDRLIPATIYTGSLTPGTEEAFNSLVWQDERTKPSWSDIETEWTAYTKESLFVYLADYRWQKETGGINVGGLPVKTDDRSKMLLAGVQKEITDANNPTHTRKVKLDTGFFDISDAQLQYLYSEVVGHTQKCFDCESSVSNLIQDGTYTTEQQAKDAFDAAYAG